MCPVGTCYEPVFGEGPRETRDDEKEAKQEYVALKRKANMYSTGTQPGMQGAGRVFQAVKEPEKPFYKNKNTAALLTSHDWFHDMNFKISI